MRGRTVDLLIGVEKDAEYCVVFGVERIIASAGNTVSSTGPSSYGAG